MQATTPTPHTGLQEIFVTNNAPSLKIPDRRIILAAGVTLLASLGSVYAWSFFTKPLRDTFLWNNMQISAVFSLAVAGLGFSALYTGPLVSKLGGRRLMFRSTKFFIAGYLISALGLYLGSGVLGSIETPWISWTSFILLALGYGVIGGIGLGTGYVTAVSTVAGWFPDKKGFATGVIVMGFGLGALFMSKVFAPYAMQLTGENIPLTFLIIAGVFSLIMPFACSFIHSAQPSQTANYQPTVAETIAHGKDVKIRLWLLCFLYSTAGLGIISLLSPLMQNFVRAVDPGRAAAELAAMGATLIAAASIGNSVGRLFWAWLSDIIGRVNAFIAMLVSAAIVFALMPFVQSPLLFGALLSYTIASYGGGFGTIPSLISDMYGPKRMSAIHGLVLTGWATAGLLAPPLFGYMNDTLAPETAARYAFYFCAIAMLASGVLSATFASLHRKCRVPVKA